MSIKQSFCYPCFKTSGMSLDHLCHEASRIGFAAIECWGRGPDFDELVVAARKHKLVIASMCGHESLIDGLNNPANHERIEAEIRFSIELAARLGIPGVICFSGNRRPGQSDAEAIEATVEGLRRIAPYAEAASVNLNLELLNSKIDHPGYQCDRTVWGVAVCEKAASPSVKLLYDIYHMQIMEGNVIRTLRVHIRRIGHFHTAGNPGRHDLDGEQELNYPAICRAIAATGYDGYVAHEFFPRGEPLEALRRAFELCNV